jgi:hypothetical protein
MKVNFRKSLIIVGLLVAPGVSFCQSTSSQNEAKQASVSVEKRSFEEYCENNALHIMGIATDKKSALKIAGTLNYIDESKYPGLKAYGLKPAENETLYYKLNGSDKILAVQSLYVLKLNYSNATK